MREKGYTFSRFLYKLTFFYCRFYKNQVILQSENV